MKTVNHLPRLNALAALAAIFGLTLTGCVSSRYQSAKTDTPQQQRLVLHGRAGTTPCDATIDLTPLGPLHIKPAPPSGSVHLPTHDKPHSPSPG